MTTRNKTSLLAIGKVGLFPTILFIKEEFHIYCFAVA